MYADIRQHAPGRERASTRKGVVMRPTTGAIASSHGAVRSRRALQRRATASAGAAATTARTARAVVRHSLFVFSLSRIFLFLFFLVYFISCCFFNPVRRCVINFYFQLLKERENFARDSGELAVKNWSCFSVCVFFVCRIEANANLLGNESSIFAAWTLCSDDDSQWRKREIRSFAETAEKKEVWK